MSVELASLWAEAHRVAPEPERSTPLLARLILSPSFRFFLSQRAAGPTIVGVGHCSARLIPSGVSRSRTAATLCG